MTLQHRKKCPMIRFVATSPRSQSRIHCNRLRYIWLV